MHRRFANIGRMTVSPMMQQYHSAKSAAGDALLDSFIFGGGNAAIDGVWCAGHKVVTRGHHHAREEVARRYRAALKRLIVGA